IATGMPHALHALAEFGGILDRHGGALGEIGQYGMRRIAQERHRSAAPMRQGSGVKERPFEPAVGGAENFTRGPSPSPGLKSGKYLGSLAGGAPARLAPVVAHDGDD